MNAKEPADESPDQTPDPSPGYHGIDARLLSRLEELSHDLCQQSAARYEYALETLLSLLWVERDAGRLAVCCALYGYPPRVEAPHAPQIVTRLAARLERSQTQESIALPPSAADQKVWIGQAVTALLMEALDVLKAEARPEKVPDARRVRCEAAVCRDALTLVRRLRCAEAVVACVRVLRFFSPDLPRTIGAPIRQTSTLHELACQATQPGSLRELAALAIGALSPDALFHFWYTLGCPEEDARRDLLPALDYLNDPRAIPYLTRLLERRFQWADGEMVGWFVVRAFARFGDRNALPPLRRVAAGNDDGSALQQKPTRGVSQRLCGTSPELVREAQRVIQAIETGRDTQERASLLRAANAPVNQLLRPAVDAPQDVTIQQQEELLRPGDGAPGPDSESA